MSDIKYLKLSLRVTVLNSSRAISHISVEIETDVSEISDFSIIMVAMETGNL
jgi:hypothetical protein